MAAQVTHSKLHAENGFAQSPAEREANGWHNAAVALADRLDPIPVEQVPVKLFGFGVTDEGRHLLGVTRRVLVPKTIKSGWKGQKIKLAEANTHDFRILDDFFAAEGQAWQLSEESILALVQNWTDTARPNGEDRRRMAHALTIALAARSGSRITGPQLANYAAFPEARDDQ
jgi:hypothetical protein